jgi:hypothetical protein
MFFHFVLTATYEVGINSILQMRKLTDGQSVLVMILLASERIKSMSLKVCPLVLNQWFSNIIFYHLGNLLLKYRDSDLIKVCFIYIYIYMYKNITKKVFLHNTHFLKNKNIQGLQNNFKQELSKY